MFSVAEELSTTESVSLAQLKEVFRAHLRQPESLKKPEGLSTGLESFDRFLFWGGIPKGALSLFRGSLGSGSTSLWLEAAARVVSHGRWVAWVNGTVPLAPLSLHHKGVDLGRFVAVEQPANEKKFFWLVQELISSGLFELIGCDLGALKLREHQARKLQAQARRAHVALVFLSRDQVLRGSMAAVFSLVVGFQERRLIVERASHRPTPHVFQRSVTYARFTLHTADRLGFGTHTAPNDAHSSTHSLSETSRASNGS